MSIDTRLKVLERRKELEPPEFEPLSDDERAYRLSVWVADDRLLCDGHRWAAGSGDDAPAVRIAELLNLAEQRRIGDG